MGAVWDFWNPAQIALINGEDPAATRSLAAPVAERNLGRVGLSTVEGRVWAARRVAASIVPALHQASTDAAGAAYVRALTDAGQPAEAAEAAWLLAQTEALVAQPLATDRREPLSSSSLLMAARPPALEPGSEMA